MRGRKQRKQRKQGKQRKQHKQIDMCYFLFFTINVAIERKKERMFVAISLKQDT